MNKLYLVFSNYSKLHLDAGKILNSNASLLAGHGLQWQASFNNFLQNMTLGSLSGQYATLWRYRHEKRSITIEEAVREQIKTKIAKLAQKADPEKDIIWFTGPMHTENLPFMAQDISSSAILSKRTITPVLLLERQDLFFMDRIKQLWKAEAHPWLTQEMASSDFFTNYYQSVKHIHELFGAENTHILISGQPNGLQAALTGLEFIFGLPQGLLAGEDYPIPRSYAALDITRALFKFPFTRDGKIYLDRQKFYKKLIQVENEQQFAQVEGLLPQAIEYGARFEEQNARLAAMLGMNSLFPKTEATLAPAPLPGLTQEQAWAFVAALNNDDRHAFLRYFRDKTEPLAPEELTLATVLENYRKKIDPVYGFTFPRPKPVLSVLTMTRNHKDFITQCMESVTAQKTDFTLEHIIIDDYSDDGTQDIIDDYASSHPHVRPVYLPYRSHKGENVKTLFTACKSPYAALCDGDDYFTAPHKLQKQVDFLTENPSCSLCFHPVLTDFENHERENFFFPPIPSLPRGKVSHHYYLGDLIRGNFIQTNSVVYRWRFQAGLPDWFIPTLVPGDWYWHLLHAERGRIGFIPEVMSVYRRHSGAFYNNAFISTKNHLCQHGMKELETYQALNRHFQRRYFASLANLANGVFTSFLELKMDKGDDSLLNEATEKYPDFALHFLKNLKIVHKKNPKLPE